MILRKLKSIECLCRKSQNLAGQMPTKEHPNPYSLGFSFMENFPSGHKSSMYEGKKAFCYAMWLQYNAILQMFY